MDESTVTHEGDRLVFRDPNGEVVCSVNDGDESYDNLLEWFNSWQD